MRPSMYVFSMKWISLPSLHLYISLVSSVVVYFETRSILPSHWWKINTHVIYITLLFDMYCLVFNIHITNIIIRLISSSHRRVSRTTWRAMDRLWCMSQRILFLSSTMTNHSRRAVLSNDIQHIISRAVSTRQRGSPPRVARSWSSWRVIEIFSFIVTISTTIRLLQWMANSSVSCIHCLSNRMEAMRSGKMMVRRARRPLCASMTHVR